MKKLKEYLAFLLACTMMVYACPVYGASRGTAAVPETSDGEYEYEGSAGFVPGEVLVCVAGGADQLAEDMTAAETADAGLLGNAGTGVLEAAEAVSLYTCSMTAGEYAARTGNLSPEETKAALLGAAAEEPSEILLLKTEEGKEQEAIDMLNSLPHVEFAERNHRYVLESVGEDSRFVTIPDAWKQQWAVNGTSAYGLGEAGTPIWEDARLNAPVNPETADYDEDQIVVALMDTGADYNNPEIRPVLWNCPESLQQTLGCGEFGWNAQAAVTKKGDVTDPYDVVSGHGTHCAGIIGACWKEAGIYGVANNVKIMAVKIGDSFIDESATLAGFHFVKRAVEAGVNIVAASNSWGGTYHGYAVERAITEIGVLGTLTVFAAGNESKNTDYYAETTSAFTSDPYVLAVNSHNAEGELSSFSNFGLKSTHVSAPGEAIYSAAACVNATMDPTDPVHFLPYEDAATGKKYESHMEHVTISSPSDYVAEENAFRFTAAKLATASTADIGAKDDPDNIHLKVDSVGQEKVELFVDLSNADLPAENDLLLGFRMTNAGWEAGRSQNPDQAVLAVTALHPGGEDVVVFNQTYKVVYGKPITATMPAGLEAAEYRIELTVQRYNEETEEYAAIDPGFAAFDDFLITDKLLSYVSMSGTSMACPAVSGTAAVLAAKFARLPSETRAKELQARIMGSVTPFKNDADRNKNRAGGYVDLVKAVEEDYSPVIQEASYDKSSGLLTLSGYFFPDAAKAAAEGWYVLLDNTKITDVTWSDDGKTAALLMGDADAGTKEYAIHMAAASSEKTGRNYLQIDTGKKADGLMERIDISGTDEDMFRGKLLGMIPLNGKLYMMQLAELDTAENGIVFWGWDVEKKGAWKRVNAETITTATLGDPDLQMNVVSSPMAYQGKLVLAIDCYEPVSGTYVTYLILLDPETGKVTVNQASPTNYETIGEQLGVVSLGEKLVFTRYGVSPDQTRLQTEVSLFAMSDGKLSRRAAHSLPHVVLMTGNCLYQEDGTFLLAGLFADDKGVMTTLTRWHVTEEACTYESVSSTDYTISGEEAEPQSQNGVIATTPLRDALISSGAINTEGYDTHIMKGLSGDPTMSADPLRVDSAKLLSAAAAATDGKYYVLALSRNGGAGRGFMCVQDLSTLGLSTLKNPGDTKKPDPTPTPTPVYGGGGTVKTSSVTFSEFWVQVGGTWYVKDRSGRLVTNAWLCDDAVKANGRNVWYLLKADGTMASDGLLMDGTGNYYSLETEHKGYFGSLRYKDGYYDVAGKQVYLKFCQDHNGAFGAVLNPDGIEALKAAYGVVHYTNGNESIRSTSQF